jgi:D-ribose pyranose/furanose isomerase RbsD
MGHGQSIVVVDAGYPIPPDAQRLDLAVKPGVPSFRQVLDILLSEYVVEHYLLADEARSENSEQVDYLRSRLSNVEPTFMPHAKFRETAKWDQRGGFARLFVRTGDLSSYGNVSLIAGWADETAEPDDCSPVAPPV